MNTRKCILVAEDEDDDVFFLRRALEKTGLAHRLIHVCDGQMAMQYLLGEEPFSDRTQNPLPDLLLLDLKMPKMDGLEVLEAIRSQAFLQGLPVVILSSSCLAADMAAATKLGANDYIVKPAEPDELRKMVLKLNERWLSGGAALAEISAAPRMTVVSG